MPPVVVGSQVRFLELSVEFFNVTQVEEYGTCTAVLEPCFAVIQAGDLQPYFNRNTDRKRLIYSVNTVKIRLQYGCKSPAWITEKYGSNTAVNHQPGLQRNTAPIRL